MLTKHLLACSHIWSFKNIKKFLMSNTFCNMHMLNNEFKSEISVDGTAKVTQFCNLLVEATRFYADMYP